MRKQPGWTAATSSERYAEPHRRYHTGQHIPAVLGRRGLDSPSALRRPADADRALLTLAACDLVDPHARGAGRYRSQRLAPRRGPGHPASRARQRMTVIRRRSGTSTPGRLDTDLWRAGSLAERLEFAPWPALPPPSSPRLTAGEQLLPARTCGASSGGWRSDFLGLHRCLRAARRVGRYGGGHGRRRRGPDWHAGGDARGRGTAGSTGSGSGSRRLARPTSPAAATADLPDRSVAGTAGAHLRGPRRRVRGRSSLLRRRAIPTGALRSSWPGGWPTAITPAAVAGSKWGYRYIGRLAPGRSQVNEVKEHSLAMFTSPSLRRHSALLGGRVALYQVHSLTERTLALFRSSDALLTAFGRPLRDTRACWSRLSYERPAAGGHAVRKALEGHGWRRPSCSPRLR